MGKRRALVWAVLGAVGLAALGPDAFAAPLKCSFDSYRVAEGLRAVTRGDALVVTWRAEPGQEGRLSLALDGGTPKIADLSLRRDAAPWTSLLSNATPDFSVVTGLRRMSSQQIAPLRDLKRPITQAELNKHRWDPFWDAPLDMTVPRAPANPPPVAGLPGTDQPGLPRNAAEIKRAEAVFAAKSCAVKTNGARLEISFPGVTLGVFRGALQYTIYQGTALIRQEVIASTQENWVAYKYDAGVKGLALSPTSRMVWRDVASQWQSQAFGGAASVQKIPLRAANRIAVAQQGATGSIAVFPPPHKFFWARETAINMGYNWYRKDSDQSYALGIRQNEHEDESEDPANWALYSARPGTAQLMPIYLYPSLSGAEETIAAALRFTNGDRYKPLPGYQVMGHHYHTDYSERWLKEGTGAILPDLEALKALGVNIASPVNSKFMVGFSGATPDAPPSIAAAAAATTTPRGSDTMLVTAAGDEGARLHSDRNFLIMPSQEVFNGPFGGHVDLLFSHPVYWDQRKPNQPFVETDARYGKVYHVGSAADLLAMARAENIMMSMPHPRTKGSTGYPDAILDRDYFLDSHFNGFGFRWGMGLDGSERRTCELRCLPLLDELSNWLANRPGPLKYAIAISEMLKMAPGDDIYASSPVSYVRLAETPRDAAPVIAALNRGDFFVTTGEVLIPSFSVEENGRQSKVLAEVQSTFPLDMVEIVWGDGVKTGRQVISATNLAPFASYRFEIPFDAAGKKWIRFAAWDSASEGAFVQPVRLGAPRP